MFGSNRTIALDIGSSKIVVAEFVPNRDGVPELVNYGASKFDLTMFMTESDRQLKTTIEYSTDLFDRETILRMLGHWRVLLEAITKDPDHPISELPLLTDVERKQLLFDWNDTKVSSRKDVCIHQLIESHR